jgi:hypothetical protein
MPSAKAVRHAVGADAEQAVSNPSRSRDLLSNHHLCGKGVRPERVRRLKVPGLPGTPSTTVASVVGT